MLLFKLLYLLPALIVGGGELFVSKVKFFLNHISSVVSKKSIFSALGAQGPVKSGLECC